MGEYSRLSLCPLSSGIPKKLDRGALFFDKMRNPRERVHPVPEPAVLVGKPIIEDNGAALLLSIFMPNFDDSAQLCRVKGGNIFDRNDGRSFDNTRSPKRVDSGAALAAFARSLRRLDSGKSEVTPLRIGNHSNEESGAARLSSVRASGCWLPPGPATSMGENRSTASFAL